MKQHMTDSSTTRRGLLGLAAAGSISAILYARTGSAQPPSGFPLTKTPAEWRRILGPQRYYILREAGTERPYSSPLNKEHRKGLFGCAGCGLPLFSSTMDAP